MKTISQSTKRQQALARGEQAIGKAHATVRAAREAGGWNQLHIAEKARADAIAAYETLAPAWWTTGYE